MARTVGKHWQGGPGDFQAMCDYCGVQWRRDQLRRDGSGLLACPDEGDGLDTVTLSQGNAANASERRMGRYKRDGANWDHDTATAPPFVPPNNPSPIIQKNVGPTGQLSVLVQAWWRADAAVTNAAGGVVGWTDQSGRGTLALPASLSAPATLVAADAAFNNQPVIRFDGATSWFTASFQHHAPMWAWIVFRQDAWALGAEVFAGAYGLIQQNASPILRLFRSSPGSDNGGAAIGTVARGRCNYTVAGTDYLLLNTTLVSDAGAGQRSSNTFVIGAGNAAGAAKCACSIAELLLCMGEPTTAEQTALDVYADQRYALSL